LQDLLLIWATDSQVSHWYPFTSFQHFDVYQHDIHICIYTSRWICKMTLNCLYNQKTKILYILAPVLEGIQISNMSLHYIVLFSVSQTSSTYLLV